LVVHQRFDSKNQVELVNLNEVVLNNNGGETSLSAAYSFFHRVDTWYNCTNAGGLSKKKCFTLP
jgi:hypothetical protein